MYYFSLTDINIQSVIILFSIRLPSTDIPIRVRLMNLFGISGSSFDFTTLLHQQMNFLNMK